MTRLLVHVEGETEETFVNEILRPHLTEFGYTKVSARILGNARQRDRRGGIRGWLSVRKDILNHLKQDIGALNTMMVDYYALPLTGERAWPGREAASLCAFPDKAARVEGALLRDILEGLEDNAYPNRFIPYVMMHEFEGLLFSDCTRFAKAIERPDLAPEFQAIRDDFSTPEEINDAPTTAPSKRVRNLVPLYQKPLQGTLAILEIGLAAIRRECPHFRNWLEQLENWTQGTSDRG